MRDLTSVELEHVYGAGGTGCNPCDHGGGHGGSGSHGKGNSKPNCKQGSKQGSRGGSYCKP